MKFSNHIWMAALLLSMVFPNMFGLIGKLKSRRDAQVAKLRNGDLDREAGLV